MIQVKETSILIVLVEGGTKETYLMFLFIKIGVEKLKALIEFIHSVFFENIFKSFKVSLSFLVYFLILNRIAKLIHQKDLALTAMMFFELIEFYCHLIEDEKASLHFFFLLKVFLIESEIRRVFLADGELVKDVLDLDLLGHFDEFV
jgi:hypothetical protein